MKALIFGSTGSIGNYIFNKLQKDNIECTGTTSSHEKIKDNIIYITSDNVDNLSKLDNIDIIIWAHGCNINDNIKNYNSKDCIEIINGSNIYFKYFK